jgi:hypothetical protein
MASLGRLEATQPRHLHMSHFHTIKKMRGARKYPINSFACMSSPQATAALHGPSPRQSLLRADIAHRSERPKYVASVRNLYTGQKEKIILSKIAVKHASQIIKHLDTAQVKAKKKDEVIKQCIIDFHAPKINEHLMSIRQYDGDSDLLLLHLDRVQAIIAKLPAGSQKCYWGNVNVPTFRWVYNHIHTRLESGDLEHAFEKFAVGLEKFATNAGIHLNPSHGGHWGFGFDPSAVFDTRNAFETAAEDNMDTSRY